jgi:hypothetical protein
VRQDIGLFGRDRTGRDVGAAAGWVPDEEDLAAYLEELEDEVGRVREDLEELRRTRPASER